MYGYYNIDNLQIQDNIIHPSVSVTTNTIQYRTNTVQNRTDNFSNPVADKCIQCSTNSKSTK